MSSNWNIDLSHLRCEIKVGTLSDFKLLHLPGNLHIRYYVVFSSGDGSRLRIDTRDLPPSSNPCCWDELATIECCQESSADPARELLEQQKVVFELRWRRAKSSSSLLGRFTGSKLLGRAEVSWKEVLASPAGMSSKRCIRFAAVSSVLGGLKPPSLSVEMKVEVVKVPNEQRINGKRKAMEDSCGCRSTCDWFGSEEDIMLAAATLNSW